MSLLPVFLKLDGRPGLLVGAGAVALEKIGSLLKTGLRLRVVAPNAVPEVRQLAIEGRLEWIERPFELSDLDGNFLVIAATDSAEVNAAVYQGARARGILANSVDDPPHCDFYFGSVVSRGELQIAISTAGESPAVAQRLRREIDEQLPEDLGRWLEDLGRLRREVLAKHPRGESRRLILHQLAQRPVCEAASCPSRQLALAPLQTRTPIQQEWSIWWGPVREIPICSLSRRCASFSQPTSSSTTTLFRRRFFTSRRPTPKSSMWASAAA